MTKALPAQTRDKKHGQRVSHACRGKDTQKTPCSLYTIIPLLITNRRRLRSGIHVSMLTHLPNNLARYQHFNSSLTFGYLVKGKHLLSYLLTHLINTQSRLWVLLPLTGSQHRAAQQARQTRSSDTQRHLAAHRQNTQTSSDN